MKQSAWPKYFVLAVAVILPACAIGYSNYDVFQRSFPIATILLVVTVLIAGLLTYFSGQAMAFVRRYTLILKLIIGAILCVNLILHFALSRELNAAQESVKERHKEEDRAEARDRARAQRQADLLKQATEFEAARRKTVQADANRIAAGKRSGVRVQPVSPLAIPPTEPSAAPPKPNAAAEGDEESPPVMKTPVQVRAKWFPWLFWVSIAEVFASVLGAFILMAIWQWDRDGDGIPDDEQEEEETRRPSRPIRQPGPHTVAPAYAQVEQPQRRAAGFAPPPEANHGARYMETRYPNGQSHSTNAPSLWQRLRRRAGRG